MNGNIRNNCGAVLIITKKYRYITIRRDFVTINYGGMHFVTFGALIKIANVRNSINDRAN